MLAEKIGSVRSALGVLAGKVDEETWNFLKMARAELSDAADLASELEARLVVPSPSQEEHPLTTLMGELARGLNFPLTPGKPAVHRLRSKQCPTITLIMARQKGNRPAPPPPSETAKPPKCATMEASDGQA